MPPSVILSLSANYLSSFLSSTRVKLSIPKDKSLPSPYMPFKSLRWKVCTVLSYPCHVTFCCYQVYLHTPVFDQFVFVAAIPSMFLLSHFKALRCLFKVLTTESFGSMESPSVENMNSQALTALCYLYLQVFGCSSHERWKPLSWRMKMNPWADEWKLPSLLCWMKALSWNVKSVGMYCLFPPLEEILNPTKSIECSLFSLWMLFLLFDVFQEAVDCEFVGSCHLNSVDTRRFQSDEMHVLTAVSVYRYYIDDLRFDHQLRMVVYTHG